MSPTFAKSGMSTDGCSRLVVLWLLVTSVVPFTTTLIGEHDELVQIAHRLRRQHHRHPARRRAARPAPEGPPGPFLDGKAESHEVGWRPALIIGLSALASVGVAFWRPTEASLAYLLIRPLTPLANWLRRR